MEPPPSKVLGQGHAHDGQEDAPIRDLNEVLNLEQRRQLVDLIVETTALMQVYMGCNKSVSTVEDPSSNSPQQAHRVRLTRHFHTWRQSVLRRIRDVVDIPQYATRRGVPVIIPSQPPERFAFLGGKFDALPTKLDELPLQDRLCIIGSLLLLLLSLESYSSYSRTLMVHITSSLHLPANDLARQEIKVAKSLIVSVKKMSAEKEAKAKVEESKAARRWKIGIASVAGAALIGVTGGLAAPLVAASFGAIMGTLGLGAVAGYLGVVAGSSVIVGSIFGAYGARMSGKMMDRYTREVKDFAFIPIRSPPVPSGPDPLAVSAEHRLRVSIAVSGWLTSRADVVNPWRVLGDDSEVFALRFERRALLQLGNSLDRIVKRAAWSIAGRHVIQKTVLAPVLGAVIVPLAFKKFSQLVDNPYRIAQQRAEKAGTILAEAIINKAQGERPLTLIGYSLGARVIYVCLMRLASRRAFGLVENVILIGAPITSSTASWSAMRSVVSGRLVNVFSENDKILRFLYRTNSMQLAVAGLERITGVPSVENYDVSDKVSGHLRYPYLIGAILESIGMENLDEEQFRAQAETLEAMDQEEEELKESEEASPLLLSHPEQLTGDEEEISEQLEKEVRRLEKLIEEDTEEALLEGPMKEVLRLEKLMEHETKEALPEGRMKEIPRLEKLIDDDTQEALLESRMGGIRMEDDEDDSEEEFTGGIQMEDLE